MIPSASADRRPASGSGYDVVVVGARCAGASTSLLLARKGYRVLLVDRSSFPSGVLSTSYVKAAGVALLDRWGVLDRVLACGAPPLHTVTHRARGVEVNGQITGGRFGLAPPRIALDHVLVEAARHAGAEFADRTGVVGLLGGAGAPVTGVLIRRGGTTWPVRASLVVGADGMNSPVARAAGARYLRDDGRLSCVYYSAWRGVGTGFGFSEMEGRWVATIPTSGGVTLVASYLPQALFASVRRDPWAYHRDCVERVAPEVAMALRHAEPTSRLIGRGDQRNFVRQSADDGWALVGDAAQHCDSISASGITNALTQAGLLAEHLDGDLADRTALAAALGAYARTRAERTEDTYREAVTLAALELPQWRLDLLRSVAAGGTSSADSYADLVSGLIDFEAFLAVAG